jgi:hypothetical protein
MKLGWPWNLISVAMTTVLTGIQMAALYAAKPVPEFAGGGEFDVPPGYPHDSFPMYAETGEHVTIEPAGAVEKTTVERPMILSFDGKPFYQGLLRASRDHIALVDERAVVR